MRYIAKLSKEDGATVVVFPDAPGCQTQADPGDDVVAVATEALTGWLEAHLVTGQVPQVPKRRAAGKGTLVVTVPLMLSVKIAVRQARKQRGWTQTELAKRAGLKQSQIARLEDPDHNPTLETIVKVADALEADIDFALQPRKQAA